MSSYEVKPFTIDFTKEYERLHHLVKEAILPEAPEFPGAGAFYGTELDDLKAIQKEWVESYDWQKEQAALNEFKHYTVEIEGLTVHFIHEKSEDPDAIPLVLLHGWPGLFVEFLPIIKPLTQSATTAGGKKVSYNVIVPSLPGFAFSSAPPEKWTIDDSARIFNTLAVDVLGYPKYALHGTDWGSNVGYSQYSLFPNTVAAVHFPFIPFFPPVAKYGEIESVQASEFGKFASAHTVTWLTNGAAYLALQTTKPNTLGFALHDNPIGQLSWFTGKYREWTDPEWTAPSQLSTSTVITTTAIFYLTKSFVSSLYIYAQNPSGFRQEYTKAPTQSPLLYSAFKHNTAYWPKEYIEKVGPLVYYKEHERGGHFPGLENPPALIEDLRAIADFF